MAHPQKNSSSNFQGTQPLDAKLDIKINGESFLPNNHKEIFYEIRWR